MIERGGVCEWRGRVVVVEVVEVEGMVDWNGVADYMPRQALGPRQSSLRRELLLSVCEHLHVVITLHMTAMGCCFSKGTRASRAMPLRRLPLDQ